MGRRQDSADDWMASVGGERHHRAHPSSFARGMQYKRALMITSLLTAPATLLGNEPFGPLDPHSQVVLAERVGQMTRDGAPVPAPTHVLPPQHPPDRDMVLIGGQLPAMRSWRPCPAGCCSRQVPPAWTGERPQCRRGAPIPKGHGFSSLLARGDVDDGSHGAGWLRGAPPLKWLRRERPPASPKCSSLPRGVQRKDSRVDTYRPKSFWTAFADGNRSSPRRRPHLRRHRFESA